MENPKAQPASEAPERVVQKPNRGKPDGAPGTFDNIWLIRGPDTGVATCCSRRRPVRRPCQDEKRSEARIKML